MMKLLSCSVLLLVLSGCGNKGPLFLPTPQPTKVLPSPPVIIPPETTHLNLQDEMVEDE